MPRVARAEMGPKLEPLIGESNKSNKPGVSLKPLAGQLE
jgi:hypothetical protein